MPGGHEALDGRGLAAHAGPGHVAADEDNPNGDSATVLVNAGGRTVHVDAEDGGPGENDDRANVMITGATESDARDFINDAEDVSAEVKQQMLTAVGL